MRELVRYGFRPARKPKGFPELSSVVTVFDAGGGSGVCYLSFSREFVEAVGHALPLGISADHPAQLYLSRTAHEWRFTVRYCDNSAGRLLWAYKSDPPWLSGLRRVYEEGAKTSAVAY